MDDLISRQAAMDEMSKQQTYKMFVGEDTVYLDANDVGSVLASLPSAQQWIPCSERLPDQNGKYLVVGRQKAINILRFDGGRWYGKWGVVAWLPLPEPYREEDTNHDR